MDQVKIGKFIAQMRKEQNLTQRGLADKLSISDKTVSKWERGRGLPEVSLMGEAEREAAIDEAQLRLNSAGEPVLVFQRYTLGPGAMGRPEIVLK